ncbi:MAG: hypothetical protein IPL60_12355 [Ardenticatenia bacterium]|nr:hypothetical protein [Ardenticatenia bacterium]
MKTNHLMLTSVLALALLGSAACSSAEDSSGSAVGDPGTGADPGAGGAVVTDPGAGAGGETKTEPQPVVPGGSDPATLEEALAGHGDTERINFQVLEEDCGKSADCIQELADLKAYIADCADCSPVVANFNDEATSAQLRSGTLPTTYPQVKDVVLVSDEASSASDETGDPGVASVTSDAAIDALVAELNKLTGEETDWSRILDMVDPANRDAVKETVTDALSAMTDDATAKALLAGETVNAEDAAMAIEGATANP